MTISLRFYVYLFAHLFQLVLFAVPLVYPIKGTSGCMGSMKIHNFVASFMQCYISEITNPANGWSHQAIRNRIQMNYLNSVHISSKDLDILFSSTFLCIYLSYLLINHFIYKIRKRTV